jgi:L-histidine N-alpha-methyltransferase
MSMPHSVASIRLERSQFAEDVEYYLTQTPRQLPSRYFYDEVGSALFEAICRLPWYDITRTEQHLLSTHGAEILHRAGSLSRLVELGPGAGEKLMTLVAARPCTPLTVHLIDVSQAALDAAMRALSLHAELSLIPHRTTYEAGMVEVAAASDNRGRTLALFLGSNIGNFDPPGADAFLLNIRSALAPGDSLLLGTDLVKPEQDLLLAYDDPLGVTAAFNRNLLVRANRELSANFDVDGFSHRAVWNAEASRVEMHLVSVRSQRVQVPAARLDIQFEEGETIWTESSYKYNASDVPDMLDRAGFSMVDQWISGSFGLTLGVAR